MRSPLFVRALTKSDERALSVASKSSDGRVVRRSQVVRLSAQGHRAIQIAKMLGLSTAGVTRVIHAFNREGLSTLPDKARPGRPPKADSEYVACLKDAVVKSPRDFGYVFSCWTLSRLREHVGRRFNVLMSPQQLSRILRKHGIVYRRPRHIMSHLRDQRDYDEKKELLAFLKKSPVKKRPGLNCSTLMSVRFTSTRP